MLLSVMNFLRAAILASLPVIAGCITKDEAAKGIAAMQGSGARPEVMPGMVNEKSPFKYPPELYAQRVQGNVTLRIFIDTVGTVRADSTSVETSSGYPGLDSAAIKGSEQLHFTPAMTGGRPIAVSILQPVYFRHPDAPPLPSDSARMRRNRPRGG
ncbi:MAG: energy transducer TonB [Anaerolineae bacterium]|nr:energy transducer TonB [Gemmatimonadaceae bacterium]